MSLQPSYFRNILFYVIVGFCNNIVVQIQAVALGWFIYSQTNSAFSLGLIGLAQFLPALPTLAFAGYAADHFDRRKVIIIGQACQAASYLGLCLTIWFVPHVILPIYLFVILISSTRQLTQPSMRALLTSAVPRDQLPRAIAISSSTQQIATIIGPAIGGLGYAVIGDHIFFTLMFFPLVSMCIMFLLQVPPNVTESRDGGSPLGRTLAGFVYIRSNGLLFGLILLDLFAVLFGGVAALLPIFARDVLQVGPSGLGLLNAAPAVGGVTLGLLLSFFSLNRYIGPTMQLAVVGYGVAIIVFGLSTNFILSLAALTVTGACDTVSMVIRHTVLQTATPDAMRGRVSAVNSVFTGASSQIGNFESGIVAGLIGAVPAVIVGGIGTLIVVAASHFIFPQIWKCDRPQDFDADALAEDDARAKA